MLSTQNGMPFDLYFLFLFQYCQSTLTEGRKNPYQVLYNWQGRQSLLVQSWSNAAREEQKAQSTRNQELTPHPPPSPSSLPPEATLTF